jgi:hypothetical protein
VKCVSTRKCQRKFHHKFPGIKVQAQQASMNLLIKQVYWVTSWQETCLKKRILTKEKLDEIWARLEHSPQKSMRCLAQETGISKSSAAKARKWWISTYLNGTENVWVYRDIIFSISHNIGKLILLFLWSDTWLVFWKSCSGWRWVMQFLPIVGM